MTNATTAETGLVGSVRPDRPLDRERAALALLALSGAAFLPFALNRFVFPKLTATALGVLLAATVPARGRLPRTAVALLAAAGAVLLAAALAARTPVPQLVGRAPRYEGALGLALYLGCAVAGARLLGSGRARGSTVSLLRWIAIAAILVGAEAVLETAGLGPLASNVARPGSLLGNASDEGAWAVLALGPLSSVAIRSGGRLFTTGAVASAIVVVCSASRGALIGAVAVVLVLMALAPRPGVRAILAAGVGCLIVGAFVVPSARDRILGAGYASETATGRVLLWGETLDLIVDHPLLGVGPSGFVDAIPRYHDAQYEREVGPINPPDSPHDWLLQAAAAGGLPLLALALALAALTVRSGLRAVRVQPTGGEAAAVGGMLAGLVGYGVTLLFHFTSPGTTPLAALFAGALLAGLAPTADRPASDVASRRARRAARPVAIACAGALVIVTACAAAAEIPLRQAIDDAASDHLSRSDALFHLAEHLRPWDPAIAATAAHAYATLAGFGITPAGLLGDSWSRDTLNSDPYSIPALTDAAALALAQRRPGSAERLLERAHALEPANARIVATGTERPTQ